MFHTIASASLRTRCDAWSYQLRENLELWGRAFKSSAREPGNANNPPAATHTHTQLKMFSHHPISSEPGHHRTPAAGEYEIVQEIGEPIFLARPCESPPLPAHLNTTLSSGAQKTSSDFSYGHALKSDSSPEHAMALIRGSLSPQ